MKKQGINWTDALDAQLRELFEAGKRDPEIAEAMGTSRYAILNRRSRLRLVKVAPVLPGREDPVALHYAGKSYRQIAAEKGLTRNQVGGRINRASPRVDGLEARAKSTAKAGQPTFYPAAKKCLWIEGGPPFVVDGEMRCCGKPPEPGRPYCAKHVKRAYVKLAPPKVRDAA